VKNQIRRYSVWRNLIMAAFGGHSQVVSGPGVRGPRKNWNVSHWGGIWPHYLSVTRVSEGAVMGGCRERRSSAKGFAAEPRKKLES
jgi:hypothetical protein